MLAFYIKTPDTYVDKKKKDVVLVPGEERSLCLEPGDGLLYKGCERPHWRDPMPGAKKSKKLLVSQQQKITIIKYFFIIAYKMVREHIVPGIKHDESMKSPLFSYPSYQYQIPDWDFKRKSLLNV
jgi:hypothetical protein